MDKLDLYNYANKHDISIIDLKLFNIKGIYFCNEKDNYIGLNYSIIDTSAEETCILAEECGHYAVGVEPLKLNNSIYSNKLINSRNEYRAKKWAIKQIVPFNELKKFLSQDLSKYEIAEKFDVTENFLEDAINIYTTDSLY